MYYFATSMNRLLFGLWQNAWQKWKKDWKEGLFWLTAEGCSPVLWHGRYKDYEAAGHTTFKARRQRVTNTGVQFASREACCPQLGQARPANEGLLQTCWETCLLGDARMYQVANINHHTFFKPLMCNCIQQRAPITVIPWDELWHFCIRMKHHL